MKENSLMIWHRALVCIDIQTEANLLVIGTKINSMVLERKDGMMQANIKDFIKMLPKKDKVNTAGLMEIDMLENGKIICLMVKAFSSGMIIECSLDNG